MLNKFASCGLYAEMIHGGMIRQDRWEQAKATGEVIGSCRECGGFLVPDDFGWEDESPILWFTARCIECGKEVAAPGGRTLKHRERGRSGQ